MAVNSLYPGFAKLFYTANGHDHRMIIPVVPQTIPMVIGAIPSLLVNSGAYVAASTCVDGLIAELVEFWPSTAGFTRVEFWGMADKDADPYYVGAVTPASGAGVSTDPIIPFSQAVFTFRTDQGGLFKMYLMEQFLAPNLEYTSATWGALGEVTGLVNYLFGTGGWARGRDGGKLYSTIKLMTKTNDALRRRYL